jgi:PBP1b-binding outer membrane lipoprotein LpoB
MKKVFSVLIAVFLLTGCKQKIEPAAIAKINGYWEIEKVAFEDGSEKKYGMNESFDYFQIDKNNTGIRKKVMPQLDGTFLVNDTFENVKIRFIGDQVFLDYSTPYMKWSEEIITLTDAELVVLNSEKKEYHYKKAGMIKLDDYGKKTK